MSLQAAAHHLASKGRGEDSLLVHMTPGEVSGLQSLAMAHGGSLTRNPDTGLPEAGFLKNILPTLIGLGANFLVPGITAAGAAAIGAGVGALSNRDNPLMGAISGGLGAYGGASIGAGLQSAGASAAANAVPAAAEATVPAQFSLAGPTQLFNPVATGSFPTQDIFAAEAAQAAAPSTGFAVPELLPPQSMAAAGPSAAQTASNTVARAAAENAFYQQPGMDRFTQGLSSSLANPSDFMSSVGGGSGFLKSAAMAAAPVIMAPPETFRNPEDEYGPAPKYRYDANYTGGEYLPGSAYTGEKRYFRPTYTRLAEGGIVSLATGGVTRMPSVMRDDLPAPVQAPVQAPMQAPVQAPVLSQAQQEHQSLLGFLGFSPDDAQQRAAQYQPPAPAQSQQDLQGTLGFLGYAPEQAQAMAQARIPVPSFEQPQAPPQAQPQPVTSVPITPPLPTSPGPGVATVRPPSAANILQGFAPVQQATIPSYASSTGRYASGPARGMSGASADAMMYLSGQLPSSNSRMSADYAQQYGMPEGERMLTTMPVSPRSPVTATPGQPVQAPRKPLTLDEMIQANAPKAAETAKASSNAWLDEQAQRSTLMPEARTYLMANPDVLAAAQNSGLSPQDFAWSHYVKYGRNENRPEGGAFDDAMMAESASRERDYGGGNKAGGMLRTGGFVVPADVVSALGNGSTDAGLEALMRKYRATPIDGPGDGMSDSIPTTIEGKQKARVARGEAYLSPEQVKKAGGTKKLYAMLDRIRQNAHGKTTQQRQINPNKAMG